MSDPSGPGYAASIFLPQVFRNMRNAKLFAVDIGGSLAKVAYMSDINRIRKRHASFSSDDSSAEYTCIATGSPIYEITDEQVSGRRLHFIKFETKYVETCVDFIRENILEQPDDLVRILKATGGGAHKYTDLLTEKLGVRVEKEDEMQCLIRGCNFVLTSLANEVYEFRRDEEPQYVFHHHDSIEIYPYLLVNIGSGVSILQVESKDKFQRVGGTSMGGGTFWGLGSLLTNAKGFDELLELATQGQHKNVDMLVKDIYGGAYADIGLPGDLTASSFGKAIRSFHDSQECGHQFADADVAKCLLHMISNDIAQIASLYARLSGIKKIFFSGYFIRGIPVTMHTITFGVNYWSKGEQLPLFLRHEGYLGAIGAFLKGAEEDGNKIDLSLSKRFSFWGENFAGSSGLPSVNVKLRESNATDEVKLEKNKDSVFPEVCQVCLANTTAAAAANTTTSTITTMKSTLTEATTTITTNTETIATTTTTTTTTTSSAISACDVLELDQLSRQLELFPLLASAVEYFPDTEDLTADVAARTYWLECFRTALDEGVKRAIASQPYSPDAKERAEKFRTKYLTFLDAFHKKPFSYGSLTVRSLLDTREQCLEEFEFPDPFAEIKMQENQDAIEQFSQRLQELDKLSNDERQETLIRGVLAGNVFDWGAKEVAELMDKKLLAFETAMDKLQKRPWLIDDLDEWIQNTQDRVYKKVLVFVDNSGVDIIMGIFPFVRELLTRGTKVILAANTYPALNDVMHSELVILLHEIAALCPVIKSAVETRQLVAMETGSSSPCLDLRRIDADLAIQSKDVDLIVLEGMGRCIHTNFTAQFTCDSLKLAVIKNRWLANRLGGDMYSVVCRYTKGVTST
ncbi:hypothetical protein QZH41_009580 [Actinostola sp. cb2023]|nr:hypothetical protein QZH41_009580 [Actinostola sp. cb2023]